MAKTPSSVTNKWATRLAGSGEQIREGVQAVTEAPGAVAIRRKDKWVQGVNRAGTDGTFERGNQSYTLEEWKRATTEKGIGRIQTGAMAAKGKVEAFMSQWLPAMDEISRRVAAMPHGSLADAQARANFAIEHNANLRGKFRSR